jgi:hypothetical protein
VFSPTPSHGTTSMRAAKPLLARLLRRQSIGALTGRAAFASQASALAIAWLRASGKTSDRRSERTSSERPPARDRSPSRASVQGQQQCADRSYSCKTQSDTASSARIAIPGSASVETNSGSRATNGVDPAGVSNT